VFAGGNSAEMSTGREWTTQREACNLGPVPGKRKTVNGSGRGGIRPKRRRALLLGHDGIQTGKVGELESSAVEVERIEQNGEDKDRPLYRDDKVGQLRMGLGLSKLHVQVHLQMGEITRSETYMKVNENILDMVQKKRGGKHDI